MCSEDCMARSQAMYNGLTSDIVNLQRELEDADSVFMTTWLAKRDAEAEVATLTEQREALAELYNKAVATIMEQAREIRKLKGE